MLSLLVRNLEAIGLSTNVLENPDGSRVLVMPYGGRVLGLFGRRSEENFFWTHPALKGITSAKKLFSSDAWHNSGGDRTWLAPEVEFFFPRYPDVSVYCQPRELDPGTYHLSQNGDSLILSNRFTVNAYRSKQCASLEITKSVGSAPHPLRCSVDFDKFQGIDYAGYTLTSSLEFTAWDPKQALHVGLWCLLQLPSSGEVLIATHKASRPTVYMGNVDSALVTVGRNLTRFRTGTPGVQKIGVHALAVTGRVGYLYASGGQHALVVRNFFVNPSGEYVDAPKHKPEHKGDAVQACSVNSSLGEFSELEYHVPAIGQGTDRLYCDDSSQVWAFRGSMPQIQTLAETLLPSSRDRSLN